MDAWARFMRRGKGGGEYWLTVSDLMAALMVIFLFISVAFMMRIEKVVVAWDKTQEEIFEELVRQFEDDIEDWDAEFDQQKLIIRFIDPETLFERGGFELKPKFKEVLTSFCPRYFEVINQVIDEVEEVRIEGYTSPEWNPDSTEMQAFFENMRLSQSRTRAVMEFCFQLPETPNYEWLRSKVRAVGMSSAEVVTVAGGIIDEDASRRVEFRIRTNAEEVISSLLSELNEAAN